MNSENALKQIVKSFIDLANMAKGLVEENQLPSVPQEIGRLLPSTRGGGTGGKSRELHRVGIGESSASTTTYTNRNVRIKNLWKLPVNLLISFHVKPSDFRFLT